MHNIILIQAKLWLQSIDNIQVFHILQRKMYVYIKWETKKKQLSVKNWCRFFGGKGVRGKLRGNGGLSGDPNTNFGLKWPIAGRCFCSSFPLLLVFWNNRCVLEKLGKSWSVVIPRERLPNPVWNQWEAGMKWQYINYKLIINWEISVQS